MLRVVLDTNIILASISPHSPFQIAFPELTVVNMEQFLKILQEEA